MAIMLRRRDQHLAASAQLSPAAQAAAASLVRAATANSQRNAPPLLLVEFSSFLSPTQHYTTQHNTQLNDVAAEHNTTL